MMRSGRSGNARSMKTQRQINKHGSLPQSRRTHTTIRHKPRPFHKIKTAKHHTNTTSPQQSSTVISSSPSSSHFSTLSRLPHETNPRSSLLHIFRRFISSSIHSRSHLRQLVLQPLTTTTTATQILSLQNQLILSSKSHLSKLPSPYISLHRHFATRRSGGGSGSKSNNNKNINNNNDDQFSLDNNNTNSHNNNSRHNNNNNNETSVTSEPTLNSSYVIVDSAEDYAPVRFFPRYAKTEHLVTSIKTSFNDDSDNNNTNNNGNNYTSLGSDFAAVRPSPLLQFRSIVSPTSNTTTSSLAQAPFMAKSSLSASLAASLSNSSFPKLPHIDLLPPTSTSTPITRLHDSSDNEITFEGLSGRNEDGSSLLLSEKVDDVMLEEVPVRKSRERKVKVISTDQQPEESTPKKRVRKAKTVEHDDESVIAPPQAPKKRGRKAKVVEEQPVIAEDVVQQEEEVPKKHGRKPKVVEEPVIDEDVVQQEEEVPLPTPKKRTTKAKVVVPEPEQHQEEEAPAPKKRGRSKKVTADAEEESVVVPEPEQPQVEEVVVPKKRGRSKKVTTDTTADVDDMPSPPVVETPPKRTTRKTKSTIVQDAALLDDAATTDVDREPEPEVVVEKKKRTTRTKRVSSHTRHEQDLVYDLPSSKAIRM